MATDDLYEGVKLGAGRYIGYRVAIRGETLAVGATLETATVTGTNGFAPEAGAVYVFE